MFVRGVLWHFTHRRSFSAFRPLHHQIITPQSILYTISFGRRLHSQFIAPVVPVTIIVRLMDSSPPQSTAHPCFRERGRHLYSGYCAGYNKHSYSPRHHYRSWWWRLADGTAGDHLARLQGRILQLSSGGRRAPYGASALFSVQAISVPAGRAAIPPRAPYGQTRQTLFDAIQPVAGAF